MKCKRITDTWPFKLKKGSLVTIVIFLGSLVGWFIRGWYADVNFDRAAFAKDIQVLKQDSAILMETMPKIEKKLDKIINMHLFK